MKQSFSLAHLKVVRSALRGMATAALLSLAACASADPAYYTLQSEAGTTRPGAPLSVEVRRPGLAGYLDRSDIVLKSAGYKLDVNSQIRWAEPLGDMIGRVLAENLTQRLPGATVFTQAGAISADPTIRAEIDILNFDEDASNRVTLSAQIALERGTTHKPLSTHAITLTTEPQGPGAAALAAALSQLLSQLSDVIAGDIRSNT